MALYVLVALSGLIEAAMGISMAIAGRSHFLLVAVPNQVWDSLPGSRYVVLFAALACLAAAALHAYLLRGLLDDRAEAHTLVQAYGIFALLGGILLFAAFPNHGVKWAFLGLDALRGLLLAGLSALVVITPNTVRELHLPSVRNNRVERVVSRVERGGIGRGRGRGRDRGRDRGQDRSWERGGRGRGRGGAREAGGGREAGGAREAGGWGREREPLAEPVVAQARADTDAPARGGAGDTETRPTVRRGGRGRGRGRGSSDEAPTRPFGDVPAERGAREDFGSRRESRFATPRETEVVERPEASAFRAEIEEERAEAGLRGGGDFERPRSRSRRGGRGRGRGGRGERETRGEREGRGEREFDREREDLRERAPRDAEPRHAERPDRARPAAGVRPPWQAGSEEGGEREGEADAAAGSGDAPDYSGRRIKKGRYSTGALFRPREKRERQQRGGRYEAPPRTAWGAVEEEESARPATRTPDEPPAQGGTNGDGQRPERGNGADEHSDQE
jgi:hypothetical protein